MSFFPEPKVLADGWPAFGPEAACGEAGSESSESSGDSDPGVAEARALPKPLPPPGGGCESAVEH